MKGLKLVLLMALSALTLAGCRVSGELENQAYVLVLGLDRAEDGALALTAKVPQIGKGEEKDKPSGESYLLFSARGADWPRAVETLEQLTPRQMNLSHIELVAVSEDLAREADFADLVTRVAETPHLYTTARFVVCEGRARDFIDGQETVIGTRLSSEIDAMLDHYAEHGYVPRASLADFYYAVNSIYGDAVAILGSANEEAKAAASLAEPMADEAAETPMRQRYSGAALFREGTLAGTLDSAETVLLNLARGERVAIPVECGGKRYQLTPDGSARRSVSMDGEGLTLHVVMAFSTLDDICAEDARALEARLEADVAAVIRACQALGAEPFGFAEAAAARFPTLAAWRDFDWRSRYPGAGVDVGVTIRAAQGT